MDEELLPARLLVVDDHPVIRSGLAGLLQEEGYQIIGEATGVEEALALLTRATADLAVVDLTLAQGSGLDLIVALHRVPGSPEAVVYSVHEDGEWVRRALAAGAKGFVTKREDPDLLVQGLREVRAGRRYLSPVAARAMADALAEGPAVTPEQILSPQELQVYELLGRGLSTPEIAEAMGLSGRTVETYYGRMLLKLQLSGRRELRQKAVAWAQRALAR